MKATLSSILAASALLLARPLHAVEPVAAFGSNPGDLLMYRHLPAATAGPMPLVLLLHGCSQTGPAYAGETGWIDLADTHGVALVIAEQKTGNNPSRCFNWFEEDDITRGSGEAESLRQMVERMRVNVAIDPSRIFVAGLSSGGAMTAVMLATAPELFAAGAVIAGLPYRCGIGLSEAWSCMSNGRTLSMESWANHVRDASSHTGPSPRIAIWHGTADATVDPVNADSLVLQWRGVHALPATPSYEVTRANDALKVWSDSAGVPIVEFHLVSGMGHGAAVDPELACGIAATNALDVDICSAREILGFFGITRSELDAGAGPSPDAAVSVDAGTETTPDASHPIDAAMPSDAGASPDAHVPIADAGSGAGASGRGDTDGPEKCACSAVQDSALSHAWLIVVGLAAWRQGRCGARRHPA